MGLILDSSVVIAAERRGDNVPQMLKRIAVATGDQRAALSAIGLTELIHGLYRTKTLETRSRRDSFIRELLDVVDMHPYTLKTALLAGRIDGEQRNLGVVIPSMDLLIGATALELGYTVVTSNVRHFKMVPESRSTYNFALRTPLSARLILSTPRCEKFHPPPADPSSFLRPPTSRSTKTCSPLARAPSPSAA
jgi:predicted nucleic acid-binding protein